MNRQSLARLTVMALVCGLLTMFAGGIVYSQSDTVYFSYQKLEPKAVFIKLPIGVEPPEFLKDPIQSIRKKGVAVPPSAEAPWRELAAALRRLTDPQPGQSNASKRRSSGAEFITFTVVLHGFSGPVRVAVADADSVAPPTVADRIAVDRFLNDPVRSLKTQGVQIPAVDERSWKQLVDALKALQLAYAKPGEPRSGKARSPKL